jgi:DNA-binding IclR family transcriptional regulator
MMATDNSDELPLLRIMQHLHKATEAQASEVAKAMNLPRTTARTLLLKLCRLKAVEQFSPGWFAIRTPTQPREQ